MTGLRHKLNYVLNTFVKHTPELLPFALRYWRKCAFAKKMQVTLRNHMLNVYKLSNLCHALQCIVVKLLVVQVEIGLLCLCNSIHVRIISLIPIDLFKRLLHTLSKYIWATTWQKQQNECAPSEGSDQPGHPPSLIRVFAVRSMGS